MASKYGDRSSSLKGRYGTSRYTHDNTLSSCRRSRYDTYSSTSSATSPTRSRSRMTASVDRDYDYEAKKRDRFSYSRPSYSSSSSRTEERSYSSSLDRGAGRRAFSLDRDVGAGYEVTYSSTKTTRPWRDRLKEAQDRREDAYTSSYISRRAHGGSTDRVYGKSAESPLRSYRNHVYEETDYRPLVAAERTYERPRAASVSRFGSRSAQYAETLSGYEDVIKETQRKRAQSLSRFEDSDLERHRAPRRAVGQEVVEYAMGSTMDHSPRRAVVSTMDHGPRRAIGHEMVEYAGDRLSVGLDRHRGRDISHYVIHPGENFEPDKVKVVELPSGRKAVTYSRFSQTGHGDKNEANAKINEVMMRTQHLEQTASSLEDFVRRNRNYFPEDTTIYQQIRFFQLNAEQLREIGEPPEAEVYGVKVREKLVVPPGTDVAHILKRYYKNDDVDVEYSRGGVRVSGGDQIEVRRYDDMQQQIRRQVEAEYQTQGRGLIVGDDSFEVRAATQHLRKRDELTHPHPYVSPVYTQNVYRDAGLVYDDIYQGQPRSSITSPTASLISDQESLLSGGSSRKRTYDSVPHFTAKLRNKQCILGQTIKFNCSVSGLPFPDITWFKGNRLIHEGGRFKFLNNYGLLSLEITKVTKEDAGLFTVKASNPEGEVACSASLDVIDLNYGERSDGTQKPYFISEAANTAAEVGGRAIFEAQSSGRPVPTFKWQKDNMNLLGGSRVRMFEDSKGNAKLVISDLEPSDAGLYFLRAENAAGKAKCAATLRVVDRGLLGDERRRSLSRDVTPTRRRSWSREVTPVLDRPARERGTRPWFIQMPQMEVKVREGEPLTLTCMVDGDPKPVVSWTRGITDKHDVIAKVTWCKGVRELQYTERHRVVSDGDHYTMQIKTTTAYDRGQYIVIAENALGRVHANCWVNVLPVSGDSDEGEDIEYKRYKLNLPETELGWERTSEQVNQAPLFVKRLPRERTVSAGSTLSIECQVREATPEVVPHTAFTRTVKGQVELEEETVRIGRDGTVTTRTQLVDLDRKAGDREPSEEVGLAEAPPSETEVSIPVMEEDSASEDVIVTAEPIKAEEKAPEPAKEEVQAQEPAKEEEKAPEPAREEQKAPEPAREEEKAPQPAKEEEKTPEPAKEEVQAPELAKEEEKAPEPPKEEEKAPEPAKEEVQAPEPAKEEAKAPEPPKEEETTPEPAKEEQKTEEPVKEESQLSEQAKEEAQAPEPVKEEPVAAEQTAEAEASIQIVQEAEVTAQVVEADVAQSVEEEEVTARIVLSEAPPAEAEEPKAREASPETKPTEPVKEADEVDTAVPVAEPPVVAATEELSEAKAPEQQEEAKAEETLTLEVTAQAVEESTEVTAHIIEQEVAPSVEEEAVTVQIMLPETSEVTEAAEPSQSEEAKPKEEQEVAVEAEVKAEVKAEVVEEVAKSPEPVQEETQEAEEAKTEAAVVSTQEVSVTVESAAPAPTFVETMRNVMVPVGATATFSCTLNENSDASVVWSKEGKELTATESIKVTADGVSHSVIISNVQKSDEGQYTCTATNSAGSATCSGTLTVESLEKDAILVGKSAESKTEEPVTAKEESKPKETETSTEETKETKTTGEAAESEDSETDSDYTDSDSDETTSSDSESDSEDIETPIETKRKEAFSSAGYGKLRVPRMPAYLKPSPTVSVTPGRGAVTPLECLVSRDPLLATSRLHEGRQ